MCRRHLDWLNYLEGSFNTLAGFLLSLFGRIPRTGEQVSWHGWRFEVLGMRDLRIGTVRATRA